MAIRYILEIRLVKFFCDKIKFIRQRRYDDKNIWNFFTCSQPFAISFNCSQRALISVQGHKEDNKKVSFYFDLTILHLLFALNIFITPSSHAFKHLRI
jgi:hypothetical protein